ncbi:nicotinamide N-methyltransferase-like [Ptychodera flava]|uniref:nicotinamide N-methyltransferase-like n=1 Tax=Ptychodera flava TaxID=63121 RepID=UPI003969CEE2
MDTVLFGADYHDSFDPRQYLLMKEKYFDSDKNFHKNLHNSCEKGLVSDDSRVLELGGGPCIHRLISLTRKASEIISSEYTEACRREIRKWVENDPSAYDWSQHFQCVAELQGNRESWRDLEEELRGKMHDVIPCDVLKENPIAPKQYAPFDVIIVASCLEMACADRASYERSVRALNSMLGNGGVVVHWGRIGGCYYSVGDKKFFAMTVDEDFVQSAYKKAGFEVVEKVIVTDDVDDNKNVADASSFMYLLAKKIN